jgi:hypothetical protein
MLCERDDMVIKETLVYGNFLIGINCLKLHAQIS